MSFRSSRLEETEAVLSFRWSSAYEIKRNKTIDTITEIQPGLKTLKQLNKLTDKQIWEAIGVSNKKMVGTKRRSCRYCGKSEAKWEGYKLCACCKNVFYCSKECQAAHWKAGQMKKCIAMHVY